MEIVFMEGGELTTAGMVLLGALIAWSVTWTGLALWRAARLGQKGWFIALLLINSLGILEIIYLYFISKQAVVKTSSDQGMSQQ